MFRGKNKKCYDFVNRKTDKRDRQKDMFPIVEE